MATKPSVVDVEATLAEAFCGSGVRHPRQTLRDIQRRAWLGLLGAGGLTILPFLFTVVLFMLAHQLKLDGSVKLIIAMPLILLGPVLFPLAGYGALQSLFLRWGRTEVSCDRHQLVVRHGLGPSKRHYRLPMAGLKGFRVTEDSRGVDGLLSNETTTHAIATLVADYENGRVRTICWGYPKDWLLYVARELTTQCSSPLCNQPLRITREDPNSSEIHSRAEQPTNSTAKVSTSGDGLVIDIPRRGLWRCLPPYLYFFCVFWNFFNLLFFGSFFPALVAGQVEWNEGPEKVSLIFGVLFSLPFIGIGLGLLVFWRQAATLSARIVVSGGNLQVTERRLFGDRHAEWSRTELFNVRVISEASQNDNRRMYRLQIEPMNGPRYRSLDWRNKSELEWIATLICTTLEISQASPHDA